METLSLYRCKISATGVRVMAEMLKSNAAQGRQQLMVRLRRLAPGRPLAVTAIRDQYGQIVTEAEDIGRELCRHWGGVFRARQHDRGLLQQWIQEDLSTVPPPPSWKVRRGDLDRAIIEAPASSPGPDGLPLLVWRQLGSLAGDILWEALQLLQQPAGSRILQDLASLQ